MLKLPPPPCVVPLVNLSGMIENFPPQSELHDLRFVWLHLVASWIMFACCSTIMHYLAIVVASDGIWWHELISGLPARSTCSRDQFFQRPCIRCGILAVSVVTDYAAESLHGDTVASWAEPVQILVTNGEILIGPVNYLLDQILLPII